MPTGFTRKQEWLLVLLATLTAAIIGLSFYLVARLMDANHLVERSLRVRHETELALICLLDCETAVRGYLVTGDPRYLEPYQRCQTAVFDHLSNLKRLTANNARQKEKMPRLFKLAEKQIAFCQIVIGSRRHDLSLPGHVTVSLYPGKALMDEFRALHEQLLNDEELLLGQRQESVRALRDKVYAAVLLMAALVVADLLWIARMSWVHEALQEKARSEIAAARDEAVQARDVAVRANELKSQFVANISHEVRTPMSGILGFMELLKSDGSLSSDARELAEKVYLSSQELLSILNDLLDFSKLESGLMAVDSEPFAITAVLDQVLALVSPQASNKGLALVLSFDEKVDDHVIGDRQKLKQVLLNLVQNAIKFTEDGSVRLGVELVDRGECHMTVKFSVADSGIGISEDAQSRLFQPFVQADGSMQRRFGGTGLGLAISRRLVNLMGGEIGAASVEGEGSTFWFSLPLATESRS